MVSAARRGRQFIRDAVKRAGCSDRRGSGEETSNFGMSENPAVQCAGSPLAREGVGNTWLLQIGGPSARSGWNSRNSKGLKPLPRPVAIRTSALRRVGGWLITPVRLTTDAKCAKPHQVLRHCRVWQRLQPFRRDLPNGAELLQNPRPIRFQNYPAGPPNLPEQTDLFHAYRCVHAAALSSETPDMRNTAAAHVALPCRCRTLAKAIQSRLVVRAGLFHCGQHKLHLTNKRESIVSAIPEDRDRIRSYVLHISRILPRISIPCWAKK